MNLAIAAGVIAAALSPQDDLKKKYDELMKSPFLTKAAWFTDYDKALAESRKTGRPIFGMFTRSYAP